MDYDMGETPLRKSVNFPGTYNYKLHGKEDTFGSITVVDISRKGLKLKLHDEGHGFKEGDWLGVAFSDTKHEDADFDCYILQNATDKKNC